MRFDAASVAKHVHSVELCLTCDAIHFRNELGNLNLNLHAVFICVDAVCRLYCELTNALQNVGGLLEITFCSLDEGNTILDISFSLIQTTNL